MRMARDAEWIENDLSSSRRMVRSIVWPTAILVSAIPLVLSYLFPRILLAGIILAFLGPMVLVLDRRSMDRTPRKILIGSQGVTLQDGRGYETDIGWDRVKDVQRDVSYLDPNLCWILYRDEKGKRAIAPVSNTIATAIERNWTRSKR